MDNQLWCVHILGPDDVYPAPSKEEAERAVEHMQDWWKKHHPSEAALGAVAFEVVPWMHSPESHAADVGEFYKEIGMPPPSEGHSATANAPRDCDIDGFQPP